MTSLEVGHHRRPVGTIDQRVWQAWDRWVRFWFTPADPAPLGLLRLLVGGMLAYSTWVWGIDLVSFLGPDGWNSEEMIREFQRDQWNSSFWWYVPLESMRRAHYWCIGILVLFWIGFLTRITSILAFIILVSYCQRAAISNYGLDQILSLLMFYLMIGPSGQTYSVDSLLKRLWRSFRAGQRQPLHGEPPVAKSISAGLSLRLIQVHYCIIYFFAGTAKLQGQTWWTGDALWRVIANFEYQSISLVWLSRYPELLQLMTHVIILWEISFAYLIWVRPLRPLILTIGVLMHLSIGAFLGMWTFGLAMIFGYVAFLEPQMIRRLIRVPFAGSRQFASDR